VAVLRRELGETMKELQHVNITNTIVSRRSLRHFKELLGLVSGGSAVQSTYAHPGKPTREFSPTGLVDHTA
jgi:flagellar biosynthesis/type III secretory pathway chaperone